MGKTMCCCGMSAISRALSREWRSRAKAQIVPEGRDTRKRREVRIEVEGEGSGKNPRFIEQRWQEAKLLDGSATELYPVSTKDAYRIFVCWWGHIRPLVTVGFKPHLDMFLRWFFPLPSQESSTVEESTTGSVECQHKTVLIWQQTPERTRRLRTDADAQITSELLSWRTIILVDTQSRAQKGNSKDIFCFIKLLPATSATRLSYDC